MSDFVEKNLGDFRRCRLVREITRDGDAARAVVALAETSSRPVKAKTPVSFQLMGHKKALRFLLHPPLFSHSVRLAGRRKAGAGYPQRVMKTGSRQIVIKPYTLEVCFPDFLCRHIAVDTRAPSIAAG